MMRPTGDMSLGRRLRDARLRVGLSQEEVMRRLGRHNERQSWISNIETGRRGIRFSDLIALARLYGTTTDALLGVDTPKSLRERASDYVASEIVEVPVYAAQAGADGIEVTVVGYEYIPKDVATGRAVSGFRVDDEDMAPEIQRGEVAIIDEQAKPREGRLVLAQVNGRVGVFRIVTEQRLMNNRTSYRLNDAEIKGVVIRVIRSLE